jgi:uncharacterized protein (TIGR03435 family)
VKDYQIAAAPWMAGEKYEIVANMPPGTDRSQAPAMLRTLLEARFHIQWHKEMRQMAVYAVVLGKGGVKLNPAAGPASKRIGDVWTDSDGAHLRALNSPASVLADLLTKISDRPVIDATGLTGIYDFDLTYAPIPGDTPPDSAPSLSAALAKMGLKVEKRDAQIEVLMVDHADKVPAGN